MKLGQIIEENKNELVIFECHKRVFTPANEYKNINKKAAKNITEFNLNGEAGYIVDYVSGYCYWDDKIKSLIGLGKEGCFNLETEIAEYSILDESTYENENNIDSVFICVWEGVRVMYSKKMEAVR